MAKGSIGVQLSAAETIDELVTGVVGKTFPTYRLVVYVVRFPLLALIVSVIFPLVITFAGYDPAVDVSLQSFVVDPHESKYSADLIALAAERWQSTTSTVRPLADMANSIVGRNRTKVAYRQEVRFAIDSALFFREYSRIMQVIAELPVAVTEYPPTPSKNMLEEVNMIFVKTVEDSVREASGYKSVCLRNDMHQGYHTELFPPCAPLSSLSTYFYPSFRLTQIFSFGKFTMDGEGGTYQIPLGRVMGRVLLNPNYKWYVGKEMSDKNLQTKVLRFQITYGRDANTAMGEEIAIQQTTSQILKQISTFAHPYIKVTFGGDLVQEAGILNALEKERSNALIAMPIIVVVVWLHTRSKFLAIMFLFQVLLTYFATWGLYVLATHKSLPLFSSILMVVIVSFSLHGTLAFHDTFVHSGIMATTGRTNNLSVAQRLSFTLRRAGAGVLISNVIAIAVFVVNVFSAFPAVRQFSVTMIIAILINMYMIVTFTPSSIVWHHYYFSGKRRNVQKRRDVVSQYQWELHRDETVAQILENFDKDSPGDDKFNARCISAGALKRAKQGKATTVLNEFFTDVEQGVREAAAAISASRPSAAAARRVQVVEFQEEEFLHVGSGERRRDTANMPVQYYSDRMVPAGALFNISSSLVGRSFENSALVYVTVNEQFNDGAMSPHTTISRQTAAQELTNLGGDVSTPQRDYQHCVSTPQRDYQQGANELETVNDDDQFPSSGANMQSLSSQFVPLPPNPSAAAADIERFVTKWKAIAAQGLMVTTSTKTEEQAVLGAFVAHQLCTMHDSTFVLSDTGVRAAHRRPTQGNFTSGAGVSPTRGEPVPLSGPNSGSVFERIRARMHDRNREHCCGLLGSRTDETRAQRDQRILGKRMKHETYGRVERFLHNRVAPLVNRLRWLIAAISIGLVIGAFVLAARTKGGSIPTNILDGTSVTNGYHLYDDVFQQQGHCEYCSGYYRNQSEYHTTSSIEQYRCDLVDSGMQMNLYADSCSECLGLDECLDCAGEPDGPNTRLQCGACGNPLLNMSLCDCLSPASCSYCQFNRNGTGLLYGPQCDQPCVCDETSHGVCDAYSGTCTCDNDPLRGFWDGPMCDACQDGFVGDTCTDAEGTVCPSGKIGINCSLDFFVCLNGGTMNFDGTGCDCLAGFGNALCENSAYCGNRCEYNAECSYRGVFYPDNAVSPATGCACQGNWYGGACNLCLCVNDGVCRTDGSCLCTGGPFQGEQCQHCSDGCIDRGNCVKEILNGDIQLYNYMNLRSCIAHACSAEDIATETVCTACENNFQASEMCSSHTTAATCIEDINCFWFSAPNQHSFWSCWSITSPLAFQPCACKESWSGPNCDICDGPPGSYCLESGVLVACNEVLYTAAEAWKAPAEDACGVCGGNGICIGCDGVVDSGMKYDVCGECGGSGSCPYIDAENAVPTQIEQINIPVTFFLDFLYTWPFFPESAATEYIKNMRRSCDILRNASARGLIQPGFSCIAEDYEEWAIRIRGTGANYSVSDLYKFAFYQGRLKEISFNVNNPNANEILSMSVDVLLPVLTTDSNEKKYAAYLRMLELAAQAQAPLAPISVRVYQTSTSWANAVAFAASFSSVKFTSALGVAMTFAFVCISFGSLRLGFFAALISTFVVTATLAVAYLQGWDLDAVMQICVAVVIAVACEHMVHIIDGYQDFLQSTQTHMFAIETSRFHAFRGALVRTGLSVVSSTVVIVCIALLFVGSAIQPFRRAAQVIITLHLLTFVGTVLFGGWLCLCGPLKLFRHWSVSAVMCIAMAICAGLIVLIIYLAGGVPGPDNRRVL